MIDTLVEAGHRTMRRSLLTKMLKSAESTYYNNIEIMQSVAKGIVARKVCLDITQRSHESTRARIAKEIYGSDWVSRKS